jgi:hypothetical protein
VSFWLFQRKPAIRYRQLEQQPRTNWGFQHSTLVLKHTRAPVIDKGSNRANAAVQLMAHLGRNNVNADVVQRVADQLDDRDIKILVGFRPKMSGWMGDVILKIEAAKHG